MNARIFCRSKRFDVVNDRLMGFRGFVHGILSQGMNSGLPLFGTRGGNLPEPFVHRCQRKARVFGGPFKEQPCFDIDLLVCRFGIRVDGGRKGGQHPDLVRFPVDRAVPPSRWLGLWHQGVTLPTVPD